VAPLAFRFDATERQDRWRLVGLLLDLTGVAALVGIRILRRSEECLN
jgi:hypothetical protein